MKVITRLGSFLLALALLLDGTIGSAQTLDKIRLGNSGTGINTYLLSHGLFRKHGVDLEAIYVSSGSLFNQALLGGRSQRQKLEVRGLGRPARS
jgi:hypothetical protein